MEIINKDDLPIPVVDSLVIRVKGDFENMVKIANLELKVDHSYRPLHHVKIAGEVVSVCSEITEASYMFEQHIGFPRPVRHQIYLTTNKQHIRKQKWVFRLGYHEPVFEKVTCDRPPFEAGDTVVFNYLSIDDSGYLGKDSDGFNYYELPYTAVYAYLRSKHNEQQNRLPFYQMINGYVMVEPILTEGNGNSLLTTRKSIKSQMGRIVNICHSAANLSRTEVSNGDIVRFTRNSEFVNEVDGKQVYIMKEWDIIAKYQGTKAIPVGDYLSVKIDLNQARSSNLSAGFVKAEMINTGNILETNKKLMEFSKGKKVFFDHKSSYNSRLNDTVFVREQDVYLTD